MKKIGELLVENDLISNEQVEEALRAQKQMNIPKPIGEILIDMHCITIDTLIQYIEIQLKDKYS